MTARLTPRLDIDSLRALCAIEDHGGVTRAAQFLGLSQSAVSHKIKRLETSLETELLCRRPGAPLFTDAGQDLLVYAKRILGIHDEALLSLSKTPLHGKISLGMTEDTTCSDLSRILGRFTRLYPGVSVRTQVHQSLTLQSMLSKGEIEVAIMQIFKHEVRPSDTVLFEERLHWVKSADFNGCNGSAESGQRRLEPATTRWCWRRNPPPETFREKWANRREIGRLCQLKTRKIGDEWGLSDRLRCMPEIGGTGWWPGEDSN
jgi:DNA-binding transcriptional LysR family regulator